MKKINIAVIGCSGMAEGHMYGIRDNSDKANLYAICDIDPERLASKKAKFNLDIAVSDYRELLSDPNLDAVVIVTPDQLHLEMTVAFLRAGKHVLCEKMIAADLDGFLLQKEAMRPEDSRYIGRN